MLCQTAITENVIDSVSGLQHSGGMRTHDEIRAELIRQIDAETLKQADVARHLSIAPARISEIRKGTRRIQPDEMPKLAQLLGMESTPPPLDPVLSVDQIPDWGKVAQGVWLEQQQIDEAASQSVPYDRLNGDAGITDLFAVTPEGNSMNKVFMPGTRLICRRVPFGVGQFRSGDYVIARRSAHDLYELTCKRISVDDEGVYWLHSESSDPKYTDPWRIGKPDGDHHDDNEIEVVGKVIRAVQIFET